MRGPRAREQYAELHALDAANGTGLDRHRLYESAVQSPKGDISYLLSFHRQYIGSKVYSCTTLACWGVNAAIAC